MPTLVRTPRSPAPDGALHHGKHVSREEYLKLEDDGYLYEMIDGVLYCVPSAFYRHNQCAGNFEFRLRNYLESHPYGEVVHETDVFLPDGGDIVRPDLCFILNERLSIVDGHIHDPPDLICEVLSDSTAARDLGEKSRRYLDCGVREYWIVDPRDRSIRLRWNETGRGGRFQETTGDELASRFLPGFQVKARTLFG